jgi:hypothetical protein
MKKPVFVLIFIFFLFNLITAQNSNDSTLINREEALDIYISCDYCDQDYFKENFTIINYVRDRKVADVQIIISEMETGSGGTEYMLQFIGLKQFQSLTDTVLFNLPADYTEEEERVAQLKHIQLGLVPYILKTPFANKLQLTINAAAESVEENDPWKNWVFEISGFGSADSEKSYKNLNLGSEISIQKITDDIKFESAFYSSYTENKIREYKDDSLVSSTNIYRRNYYFSNLFTKSIGEHWGIGGYLNFQNSTYGNLDIKISVQPAIEYNAFKYKHASSKQLRFLYSIGYEYFNYTDTTIFDKLKDRLFEQNLSIMLKFIVPWGSIESSIYGSNYLHDFSLFNLGIYLGSDIRLFKGLSFDLYGGFNMPRNQIALRKGEVTKEDIFVKKHEMETDYNFWFHFGLSYTFGSIYNNVVNPRFDWHF